MCRYVNEAFSRNASTEGAGVPHGRSESRETRIDGTRAAGSDDWRIWRRSGRADPSRAETMSGWAGATAQQASAVETGAALGRAPWLKCENPVGQQLLQRSNAQATAGRSPPRRLAQTRRIAVYRRITSCQPRSLAPDNPATRHMFCRGAVCTFPRNQGSKSQNEGFARASWGRLYEIGARSVSVRSGGADRSGS